MSKLIPETRKRKIVWWPLFYTVLFLVTAILVGSTVFWMKNTRMASEKAINTLGEFYLKELTERNAHNITVELEKKSKQMEKALTVLNQEHLKNEENIRQYIDMVQQMNGLDVFALVDKDGRVYTADDTFYGISRFSFLSEKITEPQIYTVKNYDTKTMIIIANPVVYDMPANIPIVSCFTGLNIENVISVEQLQSVNNRTYCRMFSKEGENLLNIQGEYQNEKNLFDIWDKGADFAMGYSLEKVKEDWNRSREGYAVYYWKNSGNTYVYYKPVPGTDLVITSLMRESNINQVVEAATQKMLRSSTIYLISVIISLLGLFFIIVIVMQNARKNQLENEQFKIMGALSNDYYDIFLMEPLRDKAITMKVKGKMVDYTKQSPHSYCETWKRYVEQFVLEEDAKKVLDAVAVENICNKLKDVSEYTLDYRIKFEGRLHYFQTKFGKIIGEEDRLIVGFRMIDAQMQAELERQKVLQNALVAAQHANRAKTTFLNNMSHDIRTPMNAIIGFTSLAATHIDKPEQVQDYLTKIQTASSHLMNLINDVLDMSRIESGKVKIEEQEVHLPELIHDLSTIVQSDISSKQLEFYIDAVDVMNEDVICDKLRLNQILLNLLSNAMKFTKPGGRVSLRIIQVKESKKGYAEYEFRVKDTGIGMSKEFQEHIFEAFTREQTSTVSGIQGTGLGMAITKSIVDIMGGTICVNSESGKGTEFIVKLSFKISGSSIKHEAIPELQGLRALIADDDVNTCMSTASMLNMIGMRAEWTTAGKEAVVRAQFASAQGDEFNAYIIDWLMPDMNGIEVVRRIRQIIGDSKPIIILTAYDWTNIEEEAREAGVTAFCSKPLFMSELQEVLSKSDAVTLNQQPQEKELSGYEGKKLLLVEDNELNQEIATEILKAMGFTIEVAGDGEEAVDKMKAASPGQYDLILMDIQMPHMDGYEATRAIRLLDDPQLALTPIIAMTANAFDEDRRTALEVGMNAHVAKPIQMDVLKDTLIQVLSGKGMENAMQVLQKRYFVDFKPLTQFALEHRKKGHPCGYLVYEAEGAKSIRYADENLIHMFGCQNFLDFREYVRGSFSTLVYKDDIDRVKNEIIQQIEQSKDRIDYVKYRIVRRDGVIREIEDIGHKRFIENGVPVFYVYLADVTDG